MYSPAERPSSSRAAPAKNLKWSDAYGISSDMVSPSGLPVSLHSTALISSIRSSIAWAILSSALPRSWGVVWPQDSNAAAAAAYARSTSSAPDIGACA